jgi:hypothetical protein
MRALKERDAGRDAGWEWGEEDEPWNVRNNASRQKGNPCQDDLIK